PTPLRPACSSHAFYQRLEAGLPPRATRSARSRTPRYSTACRPPIGSKIPIPSMSRLLWLLVSACAVTALAGTLARADDVKASGEWRVTFVVPTGTKSVNMIINQSGTRLTGTVVDEYGEFPLDGRLQGNDVTVTWSIPDDGKLMDITMKGKVNGDTITG